MREIKLTRTAENKLNKLLGYLESEWSIKVKNNFILKLDNSINHLAKFPHSGTHSVKKAGLFKKVITKQTTLYYTFDQHTLTIITVFDNRMNPDRLKKEL